MGTLYIYVCPLCSTRNVKRATRPLCTPQGVYQVCKEVMECYARVIAAKSYLELPEGQPKQ